MASGRHPCLHFFLKREPFPTSRPQNATPPYIHKMREAALACSFLSSRTNVFPFQPTSIKTLFAAVVVSQQRNAQRQPPLRHCWTTPLPPPSPQRPHWFCIGNENWPAGRETETAKKKKKKAHHRLAASFSSPLLSLLFSRETRRRELLDLVYAARLAGVARPRLLVARG